jgi:hypothetical protein
LRPATATGDAFEPSVTPALEAALKYFWMATAARHARGQNAEHSTMLVHTSQSIQVHQSFFAPIGNMRDSVLSQLRKNSASMMKGLRSQWDEEAAKVPSSSVGCDQVSFDQLAPHLVRVVENTAVKIENSQSSDRIDYHTPGQIYIVIGGNVLSRGLTLEGLTVSFFLRTASAYDTLLQMGRWFGFRPGYEDLPRVWMTDELKGFARGLRCEDPNAPPAGDYVSPEDAARRSGGCDVRGHLAANDCVQLSRCRMARWQSARGSYACRGGTQGWFSRNSNSRSTAPFLSRIILRADRRVPRPVSCP